MLKHVHMEIDKWHCSNTQKYLKVTKMTKYAWFDILLDVKKTGKV